MIIWNFKTPITFIASCVWNLSEFSGIPLHKKIAPILFGILIGSKSDKID